MTMYDPRILGPIINSTDATTHPNGGEDRLLNSRRIGGPITQLDIRMYIGANTLDLLLNIAKSSECSQVRLDRLGVIADTWVDKTGHQYEVWRFVSAPPKPARNGMLAQMKYATDNGFTR